MSRPSKNSLFSVRFEIKYLFVGGLPLERGYMKKLLSLIIAVFLLSAFAVADTPHASVTYVKRKGHSATKHHAHKATKHKAPKHTV